MSTQARALLLAAGSEAEASGWLYAFNPLLASNKYFEVNLQYKKDLSGKALDLICVGVCVGEVEITDFA